MSSPLGTPRLLGALVLTSLSAGAFATGRTLTDADYARAERFVNYKAIPLVDHAVTKVKWLDDTHFVYVDHDASGDRYLRMDSATGHAEPLFDQAKIAAALGELAGGKAPEANKLGLQGITLTADGRYQLTVHGKTYVCSADAVCAKPAKSEAKGDEPGALSPGSGYFHCCSTGWPFLLVCTTYISPTLRWSCWKVAIFFESGDHSTMALSVCFQPALSVA